MEKFEAVLPKSVRGTFMQGAPIAEDVANGIDGDWPFPLMPSPDTGDSPAYLAPLPLSSHSAPSCVLADGDESATLLIAPHELARMAHTAMQGHGAALGVAEDAARLVMFSQARGRHAVAALLRHCADGSIARDARVDIVGRHAG